MAVFTNMKTILSQIKSILWITILALIATSCAPSIGINKRLEAISEPIDISIRVRKYANEKNYFLGVIYIENKTADTIAFNFNQALIVGQDTLSPDYNIRPMSFAPQAFYIYPHSFKNWKVAWRSKKDYTGIEDLDFLPDTTFRLAKDAFPFHLLRAE